MTATAVNLVANSNADLLDKVHTFLTTNVDLVAAGEAWVSMEYTAGDNFILKGVGMGGTDEIYIGWRIENDVGNDIYNIEIQAFVGYVNGAGWESQIFPAPHTKYLCSYNQPLNYWIVANGRRFIVLEKVSTVYLSCYCGLFNSYSSPTQYPYPLYIGATSDRMQRWSATTYVSHGAHPVSGAAAVYTTLGWFTLFSSSTTGTASSGTPYTMLPYTFTSITKDIKEEHDSGYGVYPSILLGKTSPAFLGELDGYGWVSGHQQTSESTVTFDGSSWVVLQSVYRAETDDYYAVRLL